MPLPSYWVMVTDGCPFWVHMTAEQAEADRLRFLAQGQEVQVFEVEGNSDWIWIYEESQRAGQDLFARVWGRFGRVLRELLEAWQCEEEWLDRVAELVFLIPVNTQMNFKDLILRHIDRLRQSEDLRE